MNAVLRIVLTLAGLFAAILPAAAPTRILLTAPLQLNVDAVNGNDVQGCGLTTGAGACKSFKSFPDGLGCWATLANVYDLQGQPVSCVSAPSQLYVNGGIRTSQALLGAGPTSTVVMDGNGSTFESTDCSASWVTGSFGSYPNQYDVSGGVRFSLRRMTMTTDGSNSVGGVPCGQILPGPPGAGNVGLWLGGGVHATGGVVLILDGIDWGSMPNGVHIFAEGYAIVSDLYQNTTISGGAAYHAWVWTYANIIEQSDAIALLNTPNFTGAYVRAWYGGGFYAGWTKFNGLATGPTYDVKYLGFISLLGGTVLPGDQPGSCSNIGLFDNFSCGLAPNPGTYCSLADVQAGLAC